MAGTSGRQEIKKSVREKGAKSSVLAAASSVVIFQAKPSNVVRGGCGTLLLIKVCLVSERD